MNKEPVIVIVPIYKVQPSEEEIESIDRTVLILGKYEIKFVAPQGLDPTFYKSRYPEIKVDLYENKYFESTKGYSRLLVSQFFYERYSSYEFMLIAQPDVYIFRDDLKAWLNSPYDYIGAPWPLGISLDLKMGRFASYTNGFPYRVYVGNGGISLRRITKCVELLNEFQAEREWFEAGGSNEDLFFSIFGQFQIGFNIPNKITASLFAMEVAPQLMMQLNKATIPMAAHGYKKYAPDLWAKTIQTINGQ